MAKNFTRDFNLKNTIYVSRRNPPKKSFIFYLKFKKLLEIQLAFANKKLNIIEAQKLYFIHPYKKHLTNK